MSIRAFEYFDDKEKAVANFFKLLSPDGCLILITKNRNRRQKNIEKGAEYLHAFESNRIETESTLIHAGFAVKNIYPAIVKWSPHVLVFRLACELLQIICIAVSKIFTRIDLFPGITESYTYIANIKSNFQ